MSALSPQKVNSDYKGRWICYRASDLQEFDVDGHSNYRVYTHDMQLLDFLFRLDAAGHDELLVRTASQFRNHAERHTQQQSFRINVGIQKTATPGFESMNHLLGGNFGKLPPSPDRDFPALRVCGKHKLLRATLASEPFSECGVDAAMLYQGGAYYHA